jgi:uncharacterized protein
MPNRRMLAVSLACALAVFLLRPGARAQVCTGGTAQNQKNAPNFYEQYWIGGYGGGSSAGAGWEGGWAQFHAERRSRSVGESMAEDIQHPRNADPALVKAAQLSAAACDRGNQRACVQLGVAAVRGWGVPRNQQRADLIFRKACAAGEADGCGYLAIGYERDYPKEAANLYSRACFAGQGDSYACERLADLSEKGKGVAQDKALAAALYQRRCEKWGHDPCVCEGWTRLNKLGIQPADIATKFAPPAAPSAATAAPSPAVSASQSSSVAAGHLPAGAPPQSLDVNAEYAAIIAIVDKLNSSEIPAVQSQAESGNLRAQTAFGRILTQGFGLDKDSKRGMALLNSAAEKGYAPAEYLLGKMSSDGDAVPRDDARAFQWDLRAAEHGLSKAQITVATSYLDGRGVAKNLAEFEKWMRRAAEQGDAEAEGLLGIALLSGDAVKKNQAEGEKWLLQAAQKGDAPAQTALGTAYLSGEMGLSQNIPEGMNWTRKAAEQRYPAGQYLLGWAFLTGTGVPMDQATGVRWLGLAAKEDENARLLLGDCFRDGKGVKKDFVRAHMWYELASWMACPSPGQGEDEGSVCKQSKEILGQLEPQMKQKDIENARAMAKGWSFKNEP